VNNGGWDETGIWKVSRQAKKIELRKLILKDTEKQTNKYDYNDCAASQNNALGKTMTGLASAKRF
jgi:hypothetical protein